MLARVGIAALLRSGVDFEVATLAAELAAYLAGPPETLWRYFVLNIDWDLPAPIKLGRWQLSQPGGSDWAALRPVPTAEDHAAMPVWDGLLSYGQHLALAAPDPESSPMRSVRLRLSRSPVLDPAWEPLLALNLGHDSPAMTVAEYLVEPGRVVEKLYESVPYTYWGDDEIEVPQLGPLHIRGHNSERFATFLVEITNRLGALAANKKVHDRIRRSALRFLRTAPAVGYRTDVTFPEDEPGVALDYVSSLENILSGTDGGTDLTRKIAQRTAVLIGRDDSERLEISACVRKAYGVRSAIAHGVDPKADELRAATTSLRPILRRAITSAIIIGSPDLGQLCDDSLLSHSLLREEIRQPVEDFRSVITRN